MLAGRRRINPALSTALLALLAVLLCTLALGLAKSGLARPVFVLGSAGVGYLAARESTGRSVEVTVILFSFAPFLRRLVDLGAGFDPLSLMLLGPVLAMLVPSFELRHLLLARRADDGDIAPILLVGLCNVYAAMISVFSGAIAESATGVVKSLAPLLYGVWLMRRAAGDPRVIESAARAFFIVTPIMGVYAVVQYFSPPAWDRYWMISTQMLTIGEPEAFKIRVFSTMNSPASYATFAACGLLLFGFCRLGWQSAAFALPVCLGLLLSLYRTAWIGLIVGVAYCALFQRTRGRAGLVALSVLLTIGIAAGNGDFGSLVLDRIATLGGSVGQDGSGAARLGQFESIYRSLDMLTFGLGITGGIGRWNGSDVADGEIVVALVSMGVVVAPIYLFGILWAAMRALGRISAGAEPTRIVTGAVILGAMVQLPLSVITNGELGFLFWSFIGIAMARQQAPARAMPPSPPRGGDRIAPAAGRDA